MVTKVGQRKFLLKTGYTNDQLDKMSPGTAHNIISELEKANRAKREAEQRAKQESESKSEIAILKEALEYFTGMYGFKLERNDYDGEIEYSCNGYVITEDEYKTLSKAKNMINFWE